MSEARFSIVITCHNQFHLIADAVNSALAQLHPNREVIVVDDASTDSSYELLGAFDDEIRLLRLEQNQGMAGARNAGASEAIGEYLAFLDGDDMLKPWALTVYDSILRSYNPKLILANITWFQGEPPRPLELDVPAEIRLVRYQNVVEKDRTFRSCGSAIVIDRKTFASVGGFTKSVRWMPEQDLLAKLAYCGRAIQIIEPRTVYYRVHTTNTIHDVPKMIQGCHQLVTAAQGRMQLASLGARLRSYPLIGGPAFYGVKRAYRAGLYMEASRLLVRAWPSVTVAALARLSVSLFGHRPIETIPVHLRSPAQASS
jgi:hypothetical protein